MGEIDFSNSLAQLHWLYIKGSPKLPNVRRGALGDPAMDVPVVLILTEQGGGWPEYVQHHLIPRYGTVFSISLKDPSAVFGRYLDFLSSTLDKLATANSNHLVVVEQFELCTPDEQQAVVNVLRQWMKSHEPTKTTFVFFSTSAKIMVEGPLASILDVHGAVCRLGYIEATDELVGQLADHLGLASSERTRVNDVIELTGGQYTLFHEALDRIGSWHTPFREWDKELDSLLEDLRHRSPRVVLDWQTHFKDLNQAGDRFLRLLSMRHEPIPYQDVKVDLGLVNLYTQGWIKTIPGEGGLLWSVRSVLHSDYFLDWRRSSPR